MTDKEWKQYLQHRHVEKGDFLVNDEDHNDISANDPNTKPPTQVAPLAHLVMDLFALHTFFNLREPPEINVRRSDIKVILYGFGDASGSGFGRSVLEPTGLSCTVGVWPKDNESMSSNYREFSNIVDTVKEQALKGNLRGSQFGLFTDNSTVESALHKGNTPSKLLFQLILKLRSIQLEYDCEILVTHVSGKRMIAQGTDGVSRGCLKEGVASGLPMLSFIPLHLNALERQPDLNSWLQMWMGNDFTILKPEDWFSRGHDITGGYEDELSFWRTTHKSGTFVWIPPPAAADVAIEELRKARIKRQASTHVFIVLRLLTCRWRKQLLKAANLLIYLPAGRDGWPKEMFDAPNHCFLIPFL